MDLDQWVVNKEVSLSTGGRWKCRVDGLSCRDMAGDVVSWGPAATPVLELDLSTLDIPAFVSAVDFSVWPVFLAPAFAPTCLLPHTVQRCVGKSS